MFARILLAAFVAAMTVIPAGASASAIARDDQAIAYVPELPEMAELVAAAMYGYTIRAGPAADDSWDRTRDFVLARRDGTARYELFVGASVLDSAAEGAAFFRGQTGVLESDNEQTWLTDDPSLPDRYGLDELREYRLIYVAPSSGRRVGNYTRLARLGSSVAVVQAIGSAEADDMGVIDNDRGLAMVRTFELVVGRMHWYPSDPARPVPGLDPLAREWGRHGFSLAVDPTGHGQATWRTYRWCSDDPTPPCDGMIGSQIVNGGWASILFYYVDGNMAEGVVIGSAAPEVLALGPARLTLKPYGMASIEQPDRYYNLCGPDYLKLAPPEVQQQSPCGA